MPGAKKILYIIDSLSRGGAETILVNTILELVERTNWQIFLITTIGSQNEFAAVLPSSVGYRHFDCRGKNFLKGIRAIKKFVCEQGFDIIHAHLYHSIIISRLVSPPEVKLIGTYHNLDFQPKSIYYSRWRVWLDRLTYKKRYFSIYVSEQVKKSVERIRPKSSPVLVLSNFASKKFKPGYDYKNSDGLKIVAIGNLKSVKNFQLAVDAMGELNNFPITLDIYGNGPLETELLAQITANGASVNLRGKQEITPSLLNPYDVFLMTSKHEGMPISLLEAICFGMPCLLPDHLAIMKSVAGNAAHYFSIQQKDSLVKAILCLYENKPVLIGMNTTALERANDYTADHHIHSLLKVYTN